MGHASESVSERPGREGAEQPMEQPSSSTDVSNKSLSVQNGHRAFSPTPAVESREPSATNTQHLQAAQGRAGAFCALPGFAQDPTAPASTEQALFDEAARAVSEEAPSDDSELEADERDTSPAQGTNLACPCRPSSRWAAVLANLTHGACKQRTSQCSASSPPSVLVALLQQPSGCMSLRRMSLDFEGKLFQPSGVRSLNRAIALTV